MAGICISQILVISGTVFIPIAFCLALAISNIYTHRLCIRSIIFFFYRMSQKVTD